MSIFSFSDGSGVNGCTLERILAYLYTGNVDLLADVSPEELAPLEDAFGIPPNRHPLTFTTLLYWPFYLYIFTSTLNSKIRDLGKPENQDFNNSDR